eukprot:1394546-Amorphochlora_amoeboformis.AAC.2
MADRNRTTSIGQRFSNLAQWTMQKFGRAEETKLEPEFVARVHKFNSTKKELNALLKAAVVWFMLWPFSASMSCPVPPTDPLIYPKYRPVKY